MTLISSMRVLCLAAFQLGFAASAACATDVKLQTPSGNVTDANNNGPGGQWLISQLFPDGTTNSLGTQPASMTSDQIVRMFNQYGDVVTVDGAPFIPGVN